MKTNLFYILLLLLIFSCKSRIFTTDKVRKIPLHTCIGKGQNDESTTWFYIKDIADRGFSGYYLETMFKPNDFKEAKFVYSKSRPPEFVEQYASGETIQLLRPEDLPSTILDRLPELESLYVSGN